MESGFRAGRASFIAGGSTPLPRKKKCCTPAEPGEASNCCLRAGGSTILMPFSINSIGAISVPRCASPLWDGVHALPAGKWATTTRLMMRSRSTEHSTGPVFRAWHSSTCFTTRCCTSSIRCNCEEAAAASTPRSSWPRNAASLATAKRRRCCIPCSCRCNRSCRLGNPCSGLAIHGSGCSSAPAPTVY